MPLAEGNELVLGRRDKKKVAASQDATAAPALPVEILDQKASRKQVTVSVTGAGEQAKARITVGGNNPSCVYRQEEGKAAVVTEARKGAVLALELGDIVEVDGFKRLNVRKYPDGPQFGFRLVQLAA